MTPDDTTPIGPIMGYRVYATLDEAGLGDTALRSAVILKASNGRTVYGRSLTARERHNLTGLALRCADDPVRFVREVHAQLRPGDTRDVLAMWLEGAAT